MASSDPETMDFHFPEHMAKLELDLTSAAKPGFQSVVLDNAWDMLYVDFTTAEKNAALEKYAACIKEAAEGALKIFSERVKPALRLLQHRWRFDPRREPEDVPIAGAQLSLTDLQNFFGVSRGGYSLSLITEWGIYCSKWPSMSSRLKGLGMGKFWTDSEVVNWFPAKSLAQLPTLGRWYSTMPTSNVASERVFGVVRHLEDDQRRSVKEETVTIETLARVNAWLVPELQQKYGRI
jgi:hypothetical protein